MKNDALGERMKEQYEHRTRYSLPRRTYTIIRLDGKAFHTITKGFDRPFDKDLMSVMDYTAIALCSQVQGVVLGYTQSDEISLILTDFATPQTDAWFDGNIQKMVSISASIATISFNDKLREMGMHDYLMNKFTYGKFWQKKLDKDGHHQMKQGLFDSRVFTIPDRTEVENYLIWRQQDAVRNSIQMAAQAVYSQKELHGKNTNILQEMLFQKNVNWNDYTSGEKRGRAVIKQKYTINRGEREEAVRSKWIALDGAVEKKTPIFTADREFLRSRIPLIGEVK